MSPLKKRKRNVYMLIFLQMKASFDQRKVVLQNLTQSLVDQSAYHTDILTTSNESYIPLMPFLLL